MKLSSRKLINIELNEDDLNFIDLYLKKKENGYSLYAFGKNGEPVTNSEIVVRYSVLGYLHEESQTLMTSNLGEVKLGSLKMVN